MPPQTVERYCVRKVETNRRFWRLDHQRMAIAPGQVLRVELLELSSVRWSFDEWASHGEGRTSDPGLSLFYLDLPTGGLPAGTTIRFKIAAVVNPGRRWTAAIT